MAVGLNYLCSVVSVLGIIGDRRAYETSDHECRDVVGILHWECGEPSHVGG
jgi:hypothetical protein